MSSELKPIKLWGAHGPNPPKVAIVLEELGLAYEVVDINFVEVKEPKFLAINPNGRMPAIEDPNTGITLWESGAIISYLVERYDEEQKLSFAPGTAEAEHARQWLFFQTTGQAPYYGQVPWFKRYHAEKVPSAIERYVKEAKRVSSVLDGWLGEQKKKYGGEEAWLVGNKMSYADLAFITWQALAHSMFKEDGFNADDYPHLKQWLGNMTSRPKIRPVLEKVGIPI